MDSEGNVIAKHEGDRTVEGFTKSAEKAQAFIDLKKKADGGDKDAKVDLFLKQLELGHLKPDAARKQLEVMGDLLKDKKKTAEDLITNGEVDEIASTITRDKETRLAAGKKMLDMKNAGHIPTADQQVQAFWVLILDYAESQKDAAVFEAALTAVKEKFKDNAQAQRFIKQKEETLKKLKEK